MSEGRIGNGVGLDTPASVVGILAMLAGQGYRVGDLPAEGDALLRRLTEGVTNDPVVRDLRPALQSLALDDYLAHFARLPAEARDALNARWGPPEHDPTLRRGRFMISGWRCGQVFVGIQPSRSREQGDYASYHDADLVPPHAYLAFYFWLRHQFSIDAVVHVGKHGNLEWLPGKALALSAARLREYEVLPGGIGSSFGVPASAASNRISTIWVCPNKRTVRCLRTASSTPLRVVFPEVCRVICCLSLAISPGL